MTDSTHKDGTCAVGRYDLGTVSLSEPALLAQPNGFFRQLRQEQPVYFDPALNMWLVSRHEDLRTVMNDPITFSVERGYQEQYAKGYFDEFKAILERDGGGFFPDPIMTDPPYHTRIRKLMDNAFTAHRVATLEPRIATIVGEVVDEFTAEADRTGIVDAVKQFSVPITIRVICEQLGISQYDAHKIQQWSLAVTAQIGRMQDRQQMRENAVLICELQNYLIARVREREEAPREDMISDLVHARSDDEANPTLSFKEVVPLVRALLIAGNETTATAMSNLVLILATQPAVARELAERHEDDRFMNRFVEELLRIEPPVRGLSRMTTREVELGGVTLPEGAHLLNLYASGNDDESVFECPRTFDMERPNINRHVAFGGGAHRCIGVSLARMEIKVAARELIKRVSAIELACAPEDITYLPTVATHSIEALPVRLTRRDC